jgi:hypothetical protein
MLNALTVVDDEQPTMRNKTAELPSLCDLLGPTALLRSADKRENLCATHACVNLTPSCWCVWRQQTREQGSAEHNREQNYSDCDGSFAAHVERPNDPSSATRTGGRVDCNSDAMAGFAAAHG